ncbi:MAG TPA: VWA domain-containing protein [Kofleriaceae bacterium]
MGITRTLVVLFVVLSAGCSKQLQLTKIDSSVQRPSNIAVYFTVDTADGDPVPGLTADKFRIYEDGSPVSVLESKQTILNPEVSATHYTLLLIDMSGSVSESDDVPVITQSASAFAARIEKFQKVAVYAFDGSPQIQPIAGFGSGTGGTSSGIARLSEYKGRDPSTNLNGAILEGLKVLKQQMRGSSTPLSFGTLVVFTDGTDRAARVPRDKLHDELDKREADIMVIGVGAEIDGGELRAIGRNGAIVSKDRAQISQSFDQMAARIEAMSKRYYLLGYCSPARAGTHVVRVETTVDGATGAVEHEFKADGFTPNCDPNRQPNFDIRRPKPPRNDS